LLNKCAVFTGNCVTNAKSTIGLARKLRMSQFSNFRNLSVDSFAVMFNYLNDKKYDEKADCLGRDPGHQI
jgi:hypothetical protein